MADYTINKNILIISIDHPPVNSLSNEVRKKVLKFICLAESDQNVQGIIICGKNKTFSVGADINEFENNAMQNHPSLNQMTEFLEKCDKPIISAIHGYALGGGLEIALGSHYRVALSSAKFGFPEVNLGLLPAAGGTQRFPRLVGISAALDWITSGKEYSAQEAANIGLLDQVFPASSNILSCALEFIKLVLNKSLQGRRISLLPVKDAKQMEQLSVKFMKKLAKHNRGAIAPFTCLQSVCNSVKRSFDDGIKQELELFNLLNSSGQSKALQYTFFSERFVSKWKTSTSVDFQTAKPLKINSTAVIGLGTMGKGIAIALSTLDIPVFILESNFELLRKSVISIRTAIERMYKRGEVDDKKYHSMQMNLVPCNSYTQLIHADLVIEAVFESLNLKKKIFKKLDEICKKSTIFASNTSTFDINVLAQQTRRPDKVAGMHFFAPAHRMKLLENIAGDNTSASTIATIMDVGKRINKCTVLVGNCHGFAANRMYAHFILESDFLVEEGAYPHQIDAVLKDYGFAMGRFEIADLSGIDVLHRIRMEELAQNLIDIDTIRICSLSETLYQSGRYGMKTDGKGWYKYVNGQFCVDDVVIKMINDHRVEMKINPRKIMPQEILERTLYPIINEGFKLLEEGIACNPETIDMIWLYGFSWPKHTGGPMFYAHTIGLPRVLQVIEDRWKLAGLKEPHWKPSRLLVNLVNRHGNPPLKSWIALSHDVLSSL